MAEKHKHIQAFFIYEIEKLLEEIQRRGIGYVNCSGTGKIDYIIDDTYFTITIEERKVED